MTEAVRVVSRAMTDVRTTLTVQVGGDGAELASVKTGLADDPVLLPPATTPAHPGVGEGSVLVAWADDRHATTVSASAGCRAHAAYPAGHRARLGPGSAARHGADRDADLLRPAARTQRVRRRGGVGPVRLRPGPRFVGDPVWERLLRTNLTDLQHLLLTDPEDPQDVFAAVGSPWYLTLFGRDALWTARLMLPFSQALARGTLRARPTSGAGRRPGAGRRAGQDPPRGAARHLLRGEPRAAAALLRHRRRDPVVGRPAARRVALGHARG
ncbi:hypothetical protein [Ornithinimicrobium flavum]|uniref:hypothetical protein n=1 Tax=Ornithinimicrobium flavum TaxID=1288636 RepID=UPI001EE7B6F6|nr:hypothetical protein [Ornithinimicrobium flavum]